MDLGRELDPVPVKVAWNFAEAACLSLLREVPVPLGQDLPTVSEGEQRSRKAECPDLNAPIMTKEPCKIG